MTPSPLALLAAVALAAVPADKPAAASTASGGAYGEEEILSLVKSLGDRQSLASDKLTDLSTALKKSLSKAEFKRLAAEKPVRGVLVYQGGEGGLLVKYMSADGLASFKGGKQAAKVSLRTWSAGAQLGGSAMWGVALVMGLARDSDLAGDYSGTNVGATAADESTAKALQLTHKDPDKKHLLWLVASGRGLSASAGAAKLTVSTGW